MARIDDRRRFESWSLGRVRLEVDARRALPPPCGSRLLRPYAPGDFLIDHSPVPESALQTESPTPAMIVMPVFNALALTKSCILALRASDGQRGRLLVVNNGSIDGTAEWLESEGIPRIDLPANLGFATAINRGLVERHPDEDVVILTNDVQVPREWLSLLAETARSRPRPGPVGVRAVDQGGRVTHTSSDLTRGLDGGELEFEGETPDCGQFSLVREVPGVSFHLVYLRADLLQEVGVLDERFFAYYEDADYCRRGVTVGRWPVLDGRVTVVHQRHATAEANGLDLAQVLLSSREAFAQKHIKDLAEEANCEPLVIRGLTAGPAGYPSVVRAWSTLLARRRWPVWTNEPIRSNGQRLDMMEESHGMSDWLESLACESPETGRVILNLGLPVSWVALQGRLSIGYTMLESFPVPRYWVDRCNLMDDVWVPCTWNRETFESSGVRRPIEVVPFPVDTELFGPWVRPFLYPEGDREVFRFLCVAEWCPRKNLETLVEAFGEAFAGRSDVELVLRTWSPTDDYVNPVLEAATHYGARYQILPRPVPVGLMPSFIRAHQAFVLPSSGEGFGLSAFEAMACGLPAVLPMATAFRDMRDVCFPVATHEGPTPADHPLYRGGIWHPVDKDSLRDALLRAVSDDEERKRLAVAGRTFVVERFGPVSSLALMKSTLLRSFERIGEEPPAWLQGAQ